MAVVRCPLGCVALVALGFVVVGCSNEAEVEAPAPGASATAGERADAGPDAATVEAPAPASSAVPDAEPAAEDSSEPIVPEGDEAEESADALAQRAQALMAAGQKQEGYETAQAAMRRFEAEGIALVWIILESVDVGDKRIDVHFNMGPKERDPKAEGIIRPLSFRVWTTREDATIVRRLDFEQGRVGGRVITAAIGEQRGSVHGNLGMLETDATYEEVLRRVVEIVEGG